MATDYLLFIHGVNNRDRRSFERSAIAMTRRLRRLHPAAWIVPITPFWGDISNRNLLPLRHDLSRDPTWGQMWFRKFRDAQVLNFVGDGVLYISRFMGAQVVEALYMQAISQLRSAQPGDRIHLITHSWGSVILFDILFAGRWDCTTFTDENPLVHEYVMDIRNMLFGLGADRQKGLRLASLHTMGSPIALFNLMNVNGVSGHDLAPELKAMFRIIYESSGRALPWRNYIHPGDPIAYPLEGIQASLFGEALEFVNLEDHFVRSSDLLDGLVGLFPQTLLPLINGGNAHGCYWQVPEVTEAIGDCINQGKPSQA
jgi:hypothetical protein